MLKVFVVDDEYELGVSIKDYLESIGNIKVYTFDNALTVLMEVESQKPDLILLDILMSGLDGLSLLSRIKSSNHNEVKVIMVTAMKKDDVAIKAEDLGADDYLEKPIDFKSLESLIRKHVPEAVLK